MDVVSRTRGAARLAATVATNPRDVRRLGGWLKSLRASTVDLRLPWLPFDVIDLLQERLTTGGAVFEYGGGGSTLWFAERATQVVTVEHDSHWFPVLGGIVGGHSNVTLLHRAVDVGHDDYVDAVGGFPDGHFDVIVVDGRHRLLCLERARTKVRVGGLLLLDDTDRDRYRPAADLVPGWPGRTYRGLTPTKRRLGVTTVWERPAG